MTRRHRLAVFVLFTIIGLVHLWALMRFPYWFVDEAWAASRAWSFIDTGQQFGPLDAGVIDRLEGYWTFLPWLPTFIQSLSLRFVAQPELFPLRLVSLLFGFLLLGTVYTIASSLYDWRHGLLSVLLVSVSGSFLYSGHLARVDVMAAAFGFMATALYIKNRSFRFWPGLLSGLCVGAAFEIHPHGAIYAPAIGALYLFDLRWSVLRQRHFWGFVTGGAIGLLLYATLHILPYPQTYLALSQLAFGPTHVPPILTLDPAVLLQAFVEMGWLLIGLYLVMLLVLIIAVFVLAKRRSRADRRLLVLSAALVGATTLLMRNKFNYYGILFTPALEMMIAAFLLDFVQWPWRGRVADYATRVFVWGCCIGAILLHLSVFRTDFSRDYETAQMRISQSIQAGDSIIGPQTYWFELYDHVYYSWEELIYYQRYAPGSTLEDAMREFHPSIFIIDGHLRVFISDEKGETTYSQHLVLSKSELDAFLNRYGELLDEFEGAHYGHFQVYRIHLGSETPDGQLR